ncbi:helix-turn-helix domain-containing protein [Pseudarthrobacter equi]|uniref:helix-turn-helix domain-containing protein n=1 Tax=Pseudarthrobacter equi TaxID=728066 RepID=UPI0021C1F49D|nr:helix-turn-helix domain-containing protein [Pseudarthrobacter equi]MCT9624246.1 helix-turn-helix domain-containing protein [Pseudarthrobacter equi]
MAFKLEEVAEMLAEPVETIAKHCRTQALKGAYKTGGKTSPWRIPPAAIDYYQRTRPNY